MKKSHVRIARTILASTLVGLVGLVSTGCATGQTEETDSSSTINVQLGWYADPESGGIYAAQEQGLYADNNQTVNIAPGGPQVSGTQLVASGKADIGIAGAESVLEAQEQGIPLVAIAAIYQDNPVGMLVHADQNATSFSDVTDLTWVVQTGALGSEWVKKELGVELNTQQYSGSISNFLHDDSLVQQGWPTNEVYQAEQAGVDVTFLPFSDSGFNPYNDVLFTTQSYLDEHRDEITKFLAATMQGWKDYLGDIDVATKTNEALLEANSEQTSQSVWFAWDKQRQYITAGDGATQIGAMSTERWQTLIEQTKELGVITKDLQPSDVFDNSLLPDIAPDATLPDAPTGSY